LTCLLARWCQVREDLLFAFEKSLATGLEEPMRSCVDNLLVRVRGGMTVDQALDLMQKNIQHDHFKDLITAIRFNFRHRGNLPALLEQLEIQLHRVEEEYDRRRLSNARDVTLTGSILILVPLLFAGRLLASAEVRSAFLESPFGMPALALSFLSYLAAIVGFLFIRRKISGS
jgi:Flp pilus assembly protein TadB